MKIRDFFSSIAQSFFNDRAWLGMTLLVAIAVFDPLAAAMGLAGAGLSLLSSWGTLQPWALRNFGLIPLNGLFLGLGLHAHFAQVPQTLLYLVLGASLLPTLAKALHGVFAGLRLGVLILPALILLWTFALISPEPVALIPAVSTPGWIPSIAKLASQTGLASQEWILGAGLVFESMGRWLFLPNAWLGLALTSVVLLASPRGALAWVSGLAVGAFVAFGLSPLMPLEECLRSAFCSGIVALGLVSLPEKVRFSRVLLGAALATVISLSMLRVSLAFGVPLFSFPYVLAFWSIQLSLRPQVRVDRGFEVFQSRSGEPVFASAQVVELFQTRERKTDRSKERAA